jgi:hypothetical protein
MTNLNPNLYSSWINHSILFWFGTFFSRMFIFLLYFLSTRFLSYNHIFQLCNAYRHFFNYMVIDLLLLQSIILIPFESLVFILTIYQCLLITCSISFKASFFFFNFWHSFYILVPSTMFILSSLFFVANSNIFAFTHVSMFILYFFQLPICFLYFSISSYSFFVYFNNLFFFFLHYAQYGF